MCTSQPRTPVRLFSRFLAAAAGLMIVSGGSAHDEDWRKLEDALPPVPGDIWRLGDPVARGAGFDSSGVTLLAHIPLNNFAGNTASGNDCWGYTSPSGREYAIMGLEGGYGFVEITDPVNPVILTTITGPSSLWHDVKVVGQYAYGVSEGGAGIQVMDLSNIDAGVVTLVRNWQAGGHSTTHNLIVDDDGTDLYLAGANIGNGGLMHLDLSDPTRPTVDGGWTAMYVHDADVVTWQGGAFDGREIAFCAAGFNGGFTSTGLRVVDITDPSNATTLATLFYPNAGYTHQVWLSSDRRYLYLNDELDEETGLVSTTLTRVIDVADPSNPQLVGTFTSGRPSIDHNLYTRDGIIFEANYRSGLRVFDGSDPLQPIEIGYFDTFPNSDAAEFNGAWSVYPFFPSGTVIVSDIERGLFILDVTAINAEQLIISPVGEVPTTLDPAGGATMSVSINEFNTQLVASSVEMTLADANGTRTVAGVDQGGGVFSFTFPPVACGGAAFSISADATNGQTFTLPADGTSYRASVVSDLVGGFADDFQTNRGWTVTSTASDGQWQRGVPVNAGRGDPPADADGSGMCYVTDNSAANGGNSDVDNGSTTLISPVLDLSGDVRISYSYWLNDIAGGNLDNDAMVVEVSLNGGASWVEMARYETASSSWRAGGFDITAGTANGRVRFTVSDNDPQSVVEGGLDAFTVEQIVCENPCPVDLAEPFGVLDLADIQAFVAAFASGGSAADLAEPFGVLDLNDLSAFVQGFLAGCP